MRKPKPRSVRAQAHRRKRARAQRQKRQKQHHGAPLTCPDCPFSTTDDATMAQHHRDLHGRASADVVWRS